MKTRYFTLIVVVLFAIIGILCQILFGWSNLISILQPIRFPSLDDFVLVIKVLLVYLLIPWFTVGLLSRFLAIKLHTYLFWKLNLLQELLLGLISSLLVALVWMSIARILGIVPIIGPILSQYLFSGGGFFALYGFIGWFKGWFKTD